MRRAALVQGLFYVTSGLWPVVHLRSFEAVTGKKRDAWLVRTTGALIAAVGTALLVAARSPSRKAAGAAAIAPSRQAVKTLGIASAAALAGADLVFVGTGEIPRVYLADAAAEAALISLWILD